MLNKPTKRELNDLLTEVRRIEEHRSDKAEKEIQKMYKQLLQDLNSFLGNEYAAYSNDDGTLNVAMLQEKLRYANFLDEVEKNINDITPQISQQIIDTVEKTYTNCYTGMIEAVKAAKNGAELAAVLAPLSVRPEVMKQAIENPISGLTLPDTLEKNRKDVVYNIKQAINVGLMNGDRYNTMAKRVQVALAGDDGRGGAYGKAMNIVRTESHRVREGGFMDCAKDISIGLEGSDLIYAATWRNMGDERVRPQRRRKTKSGWKTTYSRNGANHIKMEGQTVKVGDKFKLEPNVYAEAPSKSGTARNDCNCRCFIEYNLMTIEEFAAATGKSISEVKNIAKVNRVIDGETRKLMNFNGIADCELENTSNPQRFSNAIEAAKKANPNGGSVDNHSLEELRTFKTYLAKSDMAGVAVKPDGDITAVFKNSEWQQKGAVNDLIITARANGGTKMDCYGQFLVNSYEKCGYVPVARVPFNEKYVSDPLLLKTRPDVYVMMKNTDDLETVIHNNGNNLYKKSARIDLDNLPTYEYDEALSYRDKLLELQGK